MDQKIILTGDRPTGRLHIGHFVGSLRERVRLQESGDYSKIYIMIADAQALTDNFSDPQKIRENVLEVALDYLAVGLDPTKSHLFIQSQVPQLFELTFYYMNLVTISRLSRNPTVKTEIDQRAFDSSIPSGFLNYPVSQTADITAFDATTVPVGEDQLPMLEQAHEIVDRFNYLYGDTLVRPEALLPEATQARRLPGTDGANKMSKSSGNVINLADDEETVRKKVMSMYTDPGHLRVDDPGKVEGNPVFTYLDVFSTDEDFAKYDVGYVNLEEMKAHYRRGGLGDVKVKKFLFEVLNDVLKPIRERRAHYEADIASVYEILQEGSEIARMHAQKTLDRVRDAMKINYLEDKSFHEEQQKFYQR